MHRRRILLAGAALAASPWGVPSAAPKNRQRIGYFNLQSMAASPSRERQAFLQGLRENGFVPESSVDVIYRSAEGERDFLDAMCRDLVAERPDVITVSGAVAVLAMKRATQTIPIVMLAVGDPIGIGAVKSLARPESNLTGVSFISSELAGKRVELMRQLLPAARRMQVLWDTRNANARTEARAALESARRLGFEGVARPIRADHELAPTLDRIRQDRPDVLYVVFEGNLVSQHRSMIAEIATRERLPMISGWSFLTEAGALASYAPDIPALFRRAAYYVARVLRGARPIDLPIEQASSIELVINVGAATRMGLAIPPTVLLRADRVIE